MSEHLVALKLGGVELEAMCGPIRQRYEPMGGSSELRMANGDGKKQTHWRKVRIISSGSGYLDPALEQLDYSGELELWCVKPLFLNGTGLAYQLPPEAARRPDYQPWGLALVGENWRETGLSLAGDLASLVAVPGASRYRVGWLPRYSVFTDGVVSDYDYGTGRYDWSLEARQR